MCTQRPAFNAFAVMRHKIREKIIIIIIINNNNNNNNNNNKMSLKQYDYELPLIRGATIHHTEKEFHVREPFSAWFGNSYFSPK